MACTDSVGIFLWTGNKILSIALMIYSKLVVSLQGQNRKATDKTNEISDVPTYLHWVKRLDFHSYSYWNGVRKAGSLLSAIKKPQKWNMKHANYNFFTELPTSQTKFLLK